MSVTVNQEMIDQAYKFFQENANPVKDKPGFYSVNQTDYQKFMKSQGLTEEMQRRFCEVEKATTCGAIRFTEDIMVPLIEEAKANGRDPKEIRTRIRIATGPKNKMVIDGFAHRKYPVISEPGKFTDAYGVVQLKISRGSAIDEHTVDSLTARVQSLM